MQIGCTNLPNQICSWTKVLVQGLILAKILIVFGANRLNKVLVHSCSWANRRALTYFQRWHWPQLCTWVLLWGEDKCFVYYGSERPIFWNYKFVWVAFQIIVQLLHLFPHLFVGSAIGSIAAWLFENNWLSWQIVSDDKIQITLLLLGRCALSIHYHQFLESWVL